MHKLSLIVFLFSLSCGCGAEEPDQYVHPDFQAALGLYLKVAPNQGALELVTSIDYGNLDPDLWGLCTIQKLSPHKSLRVFTHGERKIIISNDIKGSDRMPQVVLHELAHCLHNFPHQESGLMAVRTDPNVDINHLDQVLRELWTTPRY